MASPIPKHPSRRARKGSRDLTALPAAGRKGAAPKWPLLPDTERTAKKELADDRIASLTAEIEDAEDGRTKGRLRRNLAQAEQASAILSLQIEQQTDLERELWGLLWATPQATMWDASDAFARMLAQFVRWNVKGEQGDLDSAKEARIRAKEFGLTPLTLLSLKAEVERVEEVEDRGRQRRQRSAAKPKPKRDDGDPRNSFRVVS